MPISHWAWTPNQQGSDWTINTAVSLYLTLSASCYCMDHSSLPPVSCKTSHADYLNYKLNYSDETLCLQQLCHHLSWCCELWRPHCPCSYCRGMSYQPRACVSPAHLPSCCSCSGVARWCSDALAVQNDANAFRLTQGEGQLQLLLTLRLLSTKWWWGSR